MDLDLAQETASAQPGEDEKVENTSTESAQTTTIEAALASGDFVRARTLLLSEPPDSMALRQRLGQALRFDPVWLVVGLACAALWTGAAWSTLGG